MRNALYGSLAVLFTAVMPVTAWAGDRPNTEEMSSSQGTVVFVTHDYGFRGPDRIPAGLTTVRIVNQVQDLHHIQFLKLLQGK